MTSTSDRSPTSADGVIGQLYRAEWGRLVALLVSRSRRLDLAEDAVSEAFAHASSRWPADGVPANPVGWLYTTAHRHVLGRVRTEQVAGRRAPLLAVRPEWVAPDEADDALPDERLHLILLCCHPALPRDSRSALALRLVIGTSTAEIARLFLVPVPTMAARLTRAKKKIVAAGIPLGAPVAAELVGRLDEVCRTIYLAFTAGYTPGDGPQLLRSDLADDAVQLASVLHAVVPGAPQGRALLALLLLQHARRNTRERDGRLVTLADQDRSSWNADEIDRGLALLDALPPSDGYAEDLRLQALIAAEHARAPTSSATDWAVVADLYAALERRTGSPVVRLNRAVAVAEADGPLAGLAVLDGLEDVLGHHHRLAAVRSELAHRSGDTELARTSYRRAIGQCQNDVERAYLIERLALLDQPGT